MSSLRLTRRMLLTGAMSSVALAACGRAADDGATPAPTATGSASSVADAASRALSAAGVDGATASLSAQMTWPELIVGSRQYLQLVVADQEQVSESGSAALVTDPVEVWLVDEAGEVVAGPVTSTFYPDDRIPTGGLHSLAVEVTDPGLLDVVVATPDHQRAGTGAIQAMAAADSRAPGPGETIPPLDTPTVDDPQDLAELCTREPDCDLHTTTLADALDTGPVVLCIATPKFCSTAICGPVLDDVVTVADSGDFPGITFLHVEPFKDAGETVTEIMTELELPTEPWTFVLQPDGTIVQRFPGPVVPDVLTEILGGLDAAGGAS